MENKTASQLSSGLWPALLIALIIMVSLSGIADHDLWTPDEPREAAIALSMSRSGLIIIPELAGTPFVEKPPLFYILAAFSLRYLGPIIGNTSALRLVSALAGLGILFFTYLLGKIYFSRQKALLAAAILATMLGFVHVTHWLLSDNILMFFIIAAAWALANAYECNRPAYLPLAGIFAAGAFLTKGLIGPLIIFLAWAGLFAPWIKKNGWREFLSKKSVLYHSLGIIVAGLVAAVWMVSFYLKGGPELFREWWWANHFGRFTGQAIHLGHLSPWYYYFTILPVYILPWIIPFIMALILPFKKAMRKEPMPAGIIFLAGWILGAFALLSLSATKRDIYLSVLLPACALLTVYGLDDRRAAFGKRICQLWLFLLFTITLAIIAAPFFAGLLPRMPFYVGWRQVIALAIIPAAFFTLRNLQTPFLQRFLIAAMMFYSALLTIYCPIVDKYKSYGPAFRATASAIRTYPETEVAGWDLDETTVAGLYYYCDLVLPAISDRQTLDDILIGENTRFNRVLTLVKNASSKDLPDDENQVIFESHMGKRRLLQLLAAPDWEKKCRMKPSSRRPRLRQRLRRGESGALPCREGGNAE